MHRRINFEKKINKDSRPLFEKNQHEKDNNYIFIHVPKTGGRSVSLGLNVNFSMDHRCLKQYIQDLGESEVQKRYKFTVVRNPWDRAVSAYRFFHKITPTTNPMSFDEWVKDKYFKFKNPQKERKDGKFILDISSYYRNLNEEIEINEFLLFENLNKDFKKIAKRFKYVNPLPHIGKESQEESIVKFEYDIKTFYPEKKIEIEKSLDYRDLYKTQESIDIIGDLNKELIDKFNYKF